MKSKILKGILENATPEVITKVNQLSNDLLIEKLTIEQAIDQGYESFVYPEDGFQALKGLDYDIDFDKKPMLVEKEPYHPSGISAKDIAELIAENLEENHSSDSGDDTEQVYDAIMEINFSEVEKMIDEKLSKLYYYRQSDVELIKG